MSDNKKYYYLKLVDNFYERDEMIILESMPDGYMYSNILLKLYLRSLKNEGKLMFNNRIPYNASMLANVTRFPVAVVEKAIAIFKELGLIEVLDNGAIYMLDIQNFIGKSSTEADRKRLYRSKIEEEKKSLGQMSGQLIGQMSDKTPPEIDIDIEKELEKDIDAAGAASKQQQQQNPNLALIATVYEANIGSIAPAEFDLIRSWANGYTSGLVVAVIKDACLRKKKSARYIDTVLRKCAQEGVQNAADYQTRIDAYSLQNAAAGQARPRRESASEKAERESRERDEQFRRVYAQEMERRMQNDHTGSV